VPELDLSEDMRARLIWFAMETHQDLEAGLTTLLDHYLAWRGDDSTIDTLATIVRLAADLELASIEVGTLREHLAVRQALAEAGCTFADVPQALQLLDLLQALPVEWTWKQAKVAIEHVASILEGGIALRDLRRFLDRHRQLDALGFDEAAALGVAEALARTGLPADRRQTVLETLVDVAGRQVDVEALEARRQELQTEVAQLEAQEGRAAAAVQERQAVLQALRADVATLQQTRASLDAECARQAGGLAVVDALKAFLLWRTAAAEALWSPLKTLWSWQNAGGRADDSVGRLFTTRVRDEMLAFFQELVKEVARPEQ